MANDNFCDESRYTVVCELHRCDPMTTHRCAGCEWQRAESLEVMVRKQTDHIKRLEHDIAQLEAEVKD